MLAAVPRTERPAIPAAPSTSGATSEWQGTILALRKRSKQLSTGQPATARQLAKPVSYHDIVTLFRYKPKKAQLSYRKT